MSRKSIIIIVSAVILAVIAGMTLYMTQGGEDGIEKKLRLANQYIMEEKYEEAILAFQEIIDIDENNVEARLGLVNAYTGLGEYYKAEEVLRRGIALDGAQTAYWDALLELYKKAGKSDAEVQSLMKEAYEAMGNEKYKVEEPTTVAATTTSETTITTEEISTETSEEITESTTEETTETTTEETTTTTTENQDLGDGTIPLDDPEKVIIFQDPVFEQFVREYYGLGDGEIKWKDVGYRTDMVNESNSDEAKFTLNATDLKWFVNLQELDLTLTEVNGDLVSLSGLSNLKRIDLSWTGVSGDLSSLNGLTNLQSIGLSSMQIIGDLASFSGLINLKRIALSDTQVSGDLVSLSGLSNLEYINLSDTQVSGDLASLSSLSNLWWLEVYNTNVTGSLTLPSGEVITADN